MRKRKISKKLFIHMFVGSQCVKRWMNSWTAAHSWDVNWCSRTQPLEDEINYLKAFLRTRLGPFSSLSFRVDSRTNSVAIICLIFLVVELELLSSARLFTDDEKRRSKDAREVITSDDLFNEVSLSETIVDSHIISSNPIGRRNHQKKSA